MTSFAARPVCSAALLTSLIFRETSLVPVEASATLREISLVAAPCSSIAVAIVQYPVDSEPVVVINPKITVLDEATQGFWEGCLSIPEIRGLVYRPRKIRVDYLDLHAKPQTVTVEGFGATVFQHELDHLDGVLFVDRIEYRPGASPIAFVEEFSRFHAPTEDDDVGVLDD